MVESISVGHKKKRFLGLDFGVIADGTEPEDNLYSNEEKKLTIMR